MMSRKVKKSNFWKDNLSLIFSVTIMSVFVFLLVGMVAINKTAQSFCANSISCINDLSGDKEIDTKGVYLGEAVTAPVLLGRDELANADSVMDKEKAVLGDQIGDYKHIYVDLTNQRLYAFEGNKEVMNFPVSTGKWYPTPTGDFRIWIWLRYTRMSGGSGAGYYNLPNVPYTMYYFNNSISKQRGYSIHGAYWHNNFGHPMSHGCVNMRIEDAEKIFYWTNSNAGNVSHPTVNNPGTLITIYGITPRE